MKLFHAQYSAKFSKIGRIAECWALYSEVPKIQHRDPASAIAMLRGGATKRVRDDFLMRSIKKSSRTSAVRDDDGARDET